MDLSDERLKKILFITFALLIGILMLTNIIRHFSSLPNSTTEVFPTIAQASPVRRTDIFPTLKPSEVKVELEEILSKRADLSSIQKASIASLSAELVLHPKMDTDLEITYSPTLNLFFVRKRSSTDDTLILDYLTDPVIKRMYVDNSAYRLFVFTKGSAEYSKYVFERQYNELRNKL